MISNVEEDGSLEVSEAIRRIEANPERLSAPVNPESYGTFI